MACERYRDALSELAAGVAGPAGVEAHLASCADCRAELAAFRRALALVDAELAELRSAEPSAELAVRIRSAIADSGAGRAQQAVWLWSALAAAAALLVVLAVVVRLAPTPAHEVAGGRPAPSAHETPTPEPVAPPAHVSTTEPAAAARPSPKTATDRPPRSARPAEPQVLVPPGEAEALILFAASLQRRAVSRESLLVADLTAPLAEPAGLEIRPLEIVPLDPEWESGAD